MCMYVQCLTVHCSVYRILHVHTELLVLRNKLPLPWHLVMGCRVWRWCWKPAWEFIADPQLGSPAFVNQHQADKCLRGDGENEWKHRNAQRKNNSGLNLQIASYKRSCQHPEAWKMTGNYILFCLYFYSQLWEAFGLLKLFEVKLCTFKGIH